MFLWTSGQKITNIKNAIKKTLIKSFNKLPIEIFPLEITLKYKRSKITIVNMGINLASNFKNQQRMNTI